MSERIFDTTFMAQLEQLRLHLKNKAAGQSGGGRRSRQHGISAEFSDFREYRLGDDFRRVDWNAYARFNRLILKLYMEERQMQVHLFLDVSESMTLQNKLTMAKQLAAVMSYLALSAYDQVAIDLLGDEAGQSFPMSSGRSVFMRMIDYLETAPVQQNTCLLKAIQQVPLSGSSGISYVFTDAFSEEGLTGVLDYLQYKKQTTTVIHILSREELEPAFEGDVRLIDAETKKQVEVEASPIILQEYNTALWTFINGLREECYRHGMNYELIPADLDVRQAVFEHLLRGNQ